jgi:hypothetical protein
MAKPKKANKPKLDPEADDFMAKIGGRGGRKTMKRLGSAHYARIAELSHESRRRNKAEREKKAASAR